jgi:anti-sigma B factor antagonist
VQETINTLAEESFPFKIPACSTPPAGKVRNSMQSVETNGSLVTASLSYPGNVCMVRLGAELCSEACAALTEALSSFLESESPTRLALDLSAVRDVDSTGLGLLLQLQAALRKRGRTLSLCRCSRPVRRALEATHLLHLFDLT